MFSNIGFTEIIVIGLVALLLFGPDKLPEMMRTVSKGIKQFQRAMNDVENEIKQAIEVDPAKNKSEENKTNNS